MDEPYHNPTAGPGSQPALAAEEPAGAPARDPRVLLRIPDCTASEDAPAAPQVRTSFLSLVERLPGVRLIVGAIPWPIRLRTVAACAIGVLVAVVGIVIVEASRPKPSRHAGSEPTERKLRDAGAPTWTARRPTKASGAAGDRLRARPVSHDAQRTATAPPPGASCQVPTDTRGTAGDAPPYRTSLRPATAGAPDAVGPRMPWPRLEGTIH
ncbi:MAG: hypothetical protein HYX69_02085 [Planctomycetia bacterium]|nr:hypothetical protein [Planctomycetia bacterium]